ncbi:phosphatidylethanolamine-binding protein [Mycena filopes]|nr:phosphatidylethanolamine-binding protein [Mycena filopes]
MLRLGRLAGPLRRHATNESLPLTQSVLGATAGYAAVAGASGAWKKKPTPPPVRAPRANTGWTAPAPVKRSTPKPSPAPVAVESKPEREPHVPKRPPHGRLTRKARRPAPQKWRKPRPRTPTARTAQRAGRRRRLHARARFDPTVRLARFRLGFHVLRHTEPLRRGRRGRLAQWLRIKLRTKGELQTRRNRKRLGRPEISLKRPRRWNRPLPEGVLPAYDEALKVIRLDARIVRAEAQKKRREVERVHKVLSGEVPEQKVEGEEKKILEGELEALPDMSIPAHRHLVEQRWRKDGDLDLLMERMHQMHVIPDVLPVMHPSLDLHVAARLMPQHFDALMERNKFQRRVNTFKDVIPGNYLIPQQTRVPPKLYANVFHTDVRLYTMLLVDPDVPDEENQTFTTFLHWLKPNIPLSATHVGRIPLLNTHTRYIPPHPQRGTPYHRYTTLLLLQPPTPGTRYSYNTEALLTEQQARLSQSVRDRAAIDAQLVREVEQTIIPANERLGFDVRAFVKHYGLNAALGGGAHMFREVWDDYVSSVYKYELHRQQPTYGRPPRHDPQRTVHSAPTRQKYRIDA